VRYKPLEPVNTFLFFMDACTHKYINKYISYVLFQLLDSKDLNIIKVTDHGSGQVLEFSVGENISTLGSKLEIKLPSTMEMR
jgi:hypothetical protein